MHNIDRQLYEFPLPYLQDIKCLRFIQIAPFTQTSTKLRSLFWLIVRFRKKVGNHCFRVQEPLLQITALGKLEKPCVHGQQHHKNSLPHWHRRVASMGTGIRHCSFILFSFPFFVTWKNVQWLSLLVVPLSLHVSRQARL